jgi:hypothetical protein
MYHKLQSQPGAGMLFLATFGRVILTKTGTELTASLASLVADEGGLHIPMLSFSRHHLKPSTRRILVSRGKPAPNLEAKRA